MLGEKSFSFPKQSSLSNPPLNIAIAFLFFIEFKSSTKKKISETPQTVHIQCGLILIGPILTKLRLLQKKHEDGKFNH